MTTDLVGRNADLPVSIISARNDLLGGRLNSAVNALRIAQDYGMGARILWPEGQNGQTAYDKQLSVPEVLFHRNFLDDHFWTNPDEMIQAQIKQSEVISRSDQLMTQDEFDARLKQGAVFQVQDRSGRHVFGWEHPMEVAKAFRKTFLGLEFSDQVKDMMASTTLDMKRYDKKPVSVHARRGDYLQQTKMSLGAWPGFYWPDEIYIKVIEKLLHEGADVHFYCGDVRVAESYKARFPLVSIEPEAPPSSKEENLLFDFGQLFRMSCSSQIISSKNSAFSAIAANLGNVPNHHLNKVLGPAAIKACCSELLKRFSNGPEAFHYLGEFYQSASFLLRQWLIYEDRQRFREVLSIIEEHNIPAQRYLSVLQNNKNFDDFYNVS